MRMTATALPVTRLLPDDVRTQATDGALKVRQLRRVSSPIVCV